MRLVGPRPEAQEVLQNYTPEEMYKFACRLGITGLAQINGRGLLNWGQTLAWDLQYADAQRRTGFANNPDHLEIRAAAARRVLIRPSAISTERRVVPRRLLPRNCGADHAQHGGGGGLAQLPPSRCARHPPPGGCPVRTTAATSNRTWIDCSDSVVAGACRLSSGLPYLDRGKPQGHDHRVARNARCLARR
jgi:hypothetical protein